MQPALFQNNIVDITKGRSDREFVKEVDNIKNQIVVYGEGLGNVPYKFPVETLTEGKGTCADTTILMASMLTEGNQIASYNFKVYVWYVQLVNRSFLSDLQSITGINHAIVQVVFSDGHDWSIETTMNSFRTYSQSYAGWQYDVTTIGATSQGTNQVRPTASTSFPSLTPVELDYLSSKYAGLLSSVGLLLFSINLTTLSTPCGSFGIHNNDFMIGYCFANGSNGIVWNFLHGSRGFVVLMDYPTAMGTWQSIEGAPQFSKTSTSVLPVKMNGAYGHAYIFLEEPKQ
jgi:GH24 family phage-related lysozyme (muramidase)